MYAVVRHGGHQYRVSPGDRLVVDRLASEVGAVVGLAPVLLLSDVDGVEVDAARLDGIRVAATVTGHRRGPKIRVFTFKPKKRHRRTMGFRAELTELVVGRFVASGEPLPEPVETEIWPAAEVPGEEVAVAEAPAEPEPAAPATRGRRRTAGRAASGAPEVGTDEASVPAEPAAAAETEATHAVEAAAPRPARRSRKVAAPEPEPAEIDAAAPAATASDARKRRAGRKAAPPEASD